MKKKLPATASTEELLESLEIIDDGHLTTLEKPTEHTVLRFLADFNITSGDVIVNGRTLYKLYYYHTDEPVSTHEFNLILQGYFESKENTNGRQYFLNRKGSDLTKVLAQFLSSKKTFKKTKNPHFRKHFESFLESQGLRSGNINIPAQALFFFYDKWQYNSTLRTRLNYINFIAMLRIYFTTKKTTRCWCVVKVNQDFFDNNKQEIKTALEWGKKFNVKTKKKKNIFSKKT